MRGSLGRCCLKKRAYGGGGRKFVSGGKPRTVVEPPPCVGEFRTFTVGNSCGRRLPICGPGEARKPPTKTFVGGLSTPDLSVLDTFLPVRVTTTSTTAPSGALPNPLPTAKPSQHLPATEEQNDNNGPIVTPARVAGNRLFLASKQHFLPPQNCLTDRNLIVRIWPSY